MDAEIELPISKRQSLRRDLLLRRRIIRRTLRFTSVFQPGVTGTKFQVTLVRYLAQTFNVKYVFVDKIDVDGRHAETVALYANGGVVQNITYPLEGTPCQNVVEGTYCYYRDRVQITFPRDKLLVEMSARGYAGLPLLRSDGRTIGLIGIVSDRPLNLPKFTKKILEIVAGRAGLELEREIDDAERRKHLEELSQSEARHRSIIDVLPIPCAIIDDAGNALFHNRAFLETFGYSPEDIPSIQVWRQKAYPDPEYRSLIYKTWSEHLDASRKTGEPFVPYEAQIRTKDGAVLDVLCSQLTMGKKLQHEHLVMIQDVTARKRMEDDLRQSRDLLSSITDSTPSNIFAFDTQLRFTLLNTSLSKLYGKPKSELIGKTLYDVFPKPLADQLHEINARILATGEPDTRIEEVVNFKGESRIVETTKFPLKGPDGRIIGLGGVATDISDRIAAEDRLRQAQKLEAVGQLTAGIAHDFNNLLAVVLGNLEMLSNEAQGTPKLTSRLETAMKAVERGAALTQSLLAFARKQTLSPMVADLGAAVKDFGTLLRHSIPESIHLEILVDPQPVPVSVDKDQLGNALINLAVNARDAMKAGGTLLISVGSEERQVPKAEAEALPDGRYGVITVQDTGCGMPPEVLARAFDPFFTTKQSGQGAGLGLSMVYGFMRQSNGRAILFSTAGEGTLVKLLFPIIEVVESVATDSAETRPVAKPHTFRYRALVVDDIDDVRATISEQLAILGFEVTSATDGPSALAALKPSHGFDLLVTDIGLPGGMNGTDLATTISSKVPGIKVVTMTGYNDPQMIEPRSLASGWKSLRKPFKQSVLAEVIQELFGK